MPHMRIDKQHMARSCYKYVGIHILYMPTLEKVENEGIILGTLLKVPVRDKPHYSQCMRLSVSKTDSVSEDRT